MMKKLNKRFAFIAVLIFFIFTHINLTAYAATQKLTLVLNQFPNPNHAPLIIAMQQGFFKKQGLQVAFIQANAATPLQVVAKGQADIGLDYGPTFIEQVDQGANLIRIGTLIDKPLGCVIALKESGIQSVADLKGKHIGTKENNLNQSLLKAMLAQHQLNDQNVGIHVHDNLFKALLSHHVDAIAGILRNSEIPQFEALGKQIVAFFPEDLGIPTYSELVFVVNTSQVKDSRFPRFLKAVKEAVAYLDAHPKETWQQFVRDYPLANNKINHDTWFSTMPYFAEDPANFNSDEWRQFAEFMQANQLIKKAQPASHYAVLLS